MHKRTEHIERKSFFFFPFLERESIGNNEQSAVVLIDLRVLRTQIGFVSVEMSDLEGTSTHKTSEFEELYRRRHDWETATSRPVRFIEDDAAPFDIFKTLGELDNRKLEALPKGKDRSPVLQLDNRKLEALPEGKDRSPVLQIGTEMSGEKISDHHSLQNKKMKQKLVIQVPSNLSDRSRAKAMKIAVAVEGVESVALMGQDKNQLGVIGDGIDTVLLVNLLRKKIGSTVLVSVEHLAMKDSTEKKPDPTAHSPVTYMTYPTYPVYDIRPPNSSCSVM